VDILIFSEIKYFLSIFWLESWWDVVKHPNTPFLQVWWGWWVLAGWLSHNVRFGVTDPMIPSVTL